MIVVPAIDLIGGQVVRLKRGNYAEKTVYPGTPESYVERWQKAGAKRIHVVDLEGAKAGEIREWAALERMVKTASVPIELGGGLRTMEDLKRVFALGIGYGILGTAVLKNTDFVQEALKKFPEKILIGLDARDGKIRTEGWTENSTVEVLDVCRQISKWGAREAIYTNIEKDGVLSGPDISGLEMLLKDTNLSIILSDGVSNIEDIRALSKIKDPRFVGVICGRALCEGDLHLDEANRMVSNEAKPGKART